MGSQSSTMFKYSNSLATKPLSLIGYNQISFCHDLSNIICSTSAISSFTNLANFKLNFVINIPQHCVGTPVRTINKQSIFSLATTLATLVSPQFCQDVFNNPSAVDEHNSLRPHHALLASWPLTKLPPRLRYPLSQHYRPQGELPEYHTPGPHHPRCVQPLHDILLRGLLSKCGGSAPHGRDLLSAVFVLWVFHLLPLCSTVCLIPRS